MRTPGRCNNVQTCWLADARRDIRVSVGDPFVCPACGADLVAPPMEAIATHGFAAAMAASLALVLVAGGAGYGVVRLLQISGLPDTGPAPIARVQQPATLVAARAPAAMPPPPRTVVALAKSSATGALGPVPVAQAPVLAAAKPAAAPRPAPGGAALAQLTASQPTPPRATVPLRWHGPPSLIVLASAAAPPPVRKLSLPISFGKPVPPETDLPPPLQHWHHHGIEAARATGFLPAPGWSSDDDRAVQAASAVTDSGQGDEDVPPPTLLAANVSPATAAPDAVPDRPAETAAPPAASPGAPDLAADSVPVQVTRLNVPATEALPDTQPAERIDPREAALIDPDPDAPLRLAALKPAPADQLAVPQYPPREAEADAPGRVDVGCTITPHGLPTACAVQRHAGSRSFVAAVMAWLGSGAVRYRPHLAGGRPVTESRLYKVRFEP